MQIRLKTFGCIIAILLSILLAFGVGYYRGYLKSSRQHIGFHLHASEALYATLNQGNTKRLREDLTVMISGEGDTVHLMDENPIYYFLYESVNARSGDMSEALKKADEITAKEYPARAIPTPANR